MTQKRRLAWALALLFVVNIAVISLAQQAEAATYRQGSSGEQVRIIQTKLKNWGYYDGAVDGIYGSQTAQAVKYFQRKNGLTADGIAGPATLKALGMSSGGGGSSSQQNSAALLARVISAEARGEPYSGQVAVGAVILNRVEHPSFPNTIAGVVYSRGPLPAWWTGSSTSRWPTRPTGRPRTPSTGPIPAAEPSTILTRTRPPARGSGAAPSSRPSASTASARNKKQPPE